MLQKLQLFLLLFMKSKFIRKGYKEKQVMKRDHFKR